MQLREIIHARVISFWVNFMLGAMKFTSLERIQDIYCYILPLGSGEGILSLWRPVAPQLRV